MDKGIINPAPTPSKALTTINCHILLESKYNTPLVANSHSPTCNTRTKSTFSVNLPPSNIKGIISNDGNEVNIWISRSVAFGNIFVRSPKIGETANPGRDVNAEIDHIAIKVMRGIVPLPVFIFIYLLVKSLDWKNNNTSGIKFKITRNDFWRKKTFAW